MKFVFLIVLITGNVVAMAQTKFSSKGMRVLLPEGFRATEPSDGALATFNRDNQLQIIFSNGCNAMAKKHKSNLNRASTADLCFEIQFVKMKSNYRATWALSPRDTVINKYKCKWAELHSTIDDQEYYFIYILPKGKKYMYEVLYTGHLINKESDLSILKKIMSSYKVR